MRNLLVRNIPDPLYESLRERSKLNGRSLAAEVVDILARELAAPMLTRDEIWKRVQERRRKYGVSERSGAELIREDRDQGHGEGF